MLAAAALVLRPTLTRFAIAAFGLLVLDIAVDFSPIAHTVLKLPGFRTAHNGRHRDLPAAGAGAARRLGPRRAQPARARRRRRRSLALGAAAAIFCVPLVWMLVAGTIDLQPARPALEVAWGFEDPPAAVPGLQVTDSRRRRPIIRLNALLQWLPLAGAGLALIALRLGAVPGSAPSARGGLRRTGGPGARGGPVPGEHGLQPGDPDRPRDAAHHRSDPLPPVAAAEPLRGDGRRRARSSRSGPTSRCDTASTTRAATTIRSSAASTASGGRRRGRRSDLIPPTTSRSRREESLRTLSLLSVADVIQDPAGDPLRLPGLRLTYSARGRPRVPQRQRAAACLPRGPPADGGRRRTPRWPRSRARRSMPAAWRSPSGRCRACRRTRQPAGPAAAGAARLVSYGRERVVARATTRAALAAGAHRRPLPRLEGPRGRA